MEEPLSFDAAIERMQRFLAEQGWPTRLIWRTERDIVCLSGSELVVRRRVEPKAALAARVHYEVGLRQGLGISLQALCEVDGAACVTVYWSNDEMEAQYRMQPEHGLKLSIATTHPQGRSVGTVIWWLAARRREGWYAALARAAPRRTAQQAVVVDGASGRR